MSIKLKLDSPLSINEIDFRVQSINKGGYATILAYKDARADMNRLDSVVGNMNWTKSYSRDNKNCTVSIWCSEKKMWISKEDTGTESMAEKEKGLASDSFKRACFNWGIGRELYDYPVIKIKLKENEFDKASGKPTWDFKLKEWTWGSQFVDGKLTALAAKDESGTVRFKFGEFSKNK